MLKRMRPGRPSPSMIVAIIALVAAFGGSAFADDAVQLAKSKLINGKKIKKRTIQGNRLKRNTLTGTEIDESKLAVVPSANKANSATSADSATKATNATNATNADHATSADSAPFPQSLPSGKTLTGAFGLAASSTDTLAADGISFEFPLSSAPTGHIVTGAPTSDCPGTVTNPQASPGHVCIYDGYKENLSSTGFSNPTTGSDGSTARTGVFVFALRGGASARFIYEGTWAVTAP